jgi:putative methyltransferase (TIGR04325 family)
MQTQKAAPELTLKRVVASLQRRVRDRIHPLNGFRGVYASFAEAEHSAPRTKPLGYEAANSASWYLNKLAGVQLGDYPVLFWLREAFADSVSVLEVGGHIGEAFYGFEKVVAYPPGLVWTVLDVPSIARVGAGLAREKGRSNVRFVDDLTQTEGADILLSTGALQYIDAPDLTATITRFVVKPKHVLINFIPIYDGPAFVTVQNIGSAYCAYRVFNRKEFVGSMEEIGYKLADTWKKPRQFRLPSHPDRSFDSYGGFYFRRRLADES